MKNNAKHELNGDNVKMVQDSNIIRRLLRIKINRVTRKGNQSGDQEGTM